MALCWPFPSLLLTSTTTTSNICLVRDETCLQWNALLIDVLEMIARPPRALPFLCNAYRYLVRSTEYKQRNQDRPQAHGGTVPTCSALDADAAHSSGLPRPPAVVAFGASSPPRQPNLQSPELRGIQVCAWETNYGSTP